jgi:uncharacterized iron-regulated membrane protein
MFRFRQDRTKTLLALHGWSAVSLGLLLYAVIVTGVAAVFSEEIADWSNPLPQAAAVPFPPGTDALLRDFAEDIDPRYLDELTLFPSAGGRVGAFFHTHPEEGDGHPEEEGALAFFDPVRGERLSLREGPVGTLFEGGGASALADFMVDLHVRLHLPHPWGLLLTGVLGLAMLVAAVTGFLLHRHLIRELFTLRRRGDALLTVRDVHVIAGTWNLPFAFLLAFTGSYFSFGSAFGIPAVAMIAFEGDQERLVETVIGEPPDNDPRPAAMADFDALIRDVRERSGGTEPAFVQVAHWGRADAQVTFLMAYPDGALTGPTYLYNGASGDFLRTKPVLGQVPSVGSTVFELMTPLHFGNFAGVWSKALWFALGFAGAYVSFTGLRLWTRRRQDAPGWAPLARATLWVGYGLPLALVASAYGYFPARDGDAVVTWMFAAFFLAVAAAAVPSFFASAETTRRSLLFATGVAMAGLPVTRMASGGAGWPEAMAAGWTTLPAMDALLVLGAVLCLWTVRRPGAQPAANETLAHEH